MGYGTRGRTGQIKTYWPDDTADTIHIAGGASLIEIQAACETKWPGYDPSNIQITSETIHTDCLTFDQHDSSDYTQFLVITNASAFVASMEKLFRPAA